MLYGPSIHEVLPGRVLGDAHVVVDQKGSYDENGAGDQDAGYLAGFLKEILDGASPTTWSLHHASYNKKILDFLKDDVVGTPREATLWRRATLYNTFAKLQE